jgi:hypothetical protein
MKVLSEEHKKNISKGISGKNNPNFGKKLSQETKDKISKSRKGKRCGKEHPLFGKHHSEEAKRKIGLKNKGNKYNVGKVMTPEVKKKISETVKKRWGEGAYLKRDNTGKRCMTEQHRNNISKSQKGKKLSKEHREAVKKAMRELKRFGKKAPNWKGGRTSLVLRIRALKKFKNWRDTIYKRDNYTCQECGYRNGNGRYIPLNAHHIKSFKKVLKEFLQEYNQFSPMEDKETLIRLAIKWQPFWDINNGQTLCEKCHDLTKIGRRSEK